MQKLEPPRKAGEVVQCQGDPCGFGEAAEGEMVIVKDFLPPPEALRLRETKKITIALSKETVALFRVK